MGRFLNVTYPFGKPKEKHGTVYWRAHYKSYSIVLDAEAERYGSKTEIELTFHPVIATTPCGVRDRKSVV